MTKRYRGSGGAVWTLPDPLPGPLAEQVRKGDLVALDDDEAAGASPVAAIEPAERDAKSAWVDYAVAHGMSRNTAEDHTKAELIQQFGDGG